MKRKGKNSKSHKDSNVVWKDANSSENSKENKNTLTKDNVFLENIKRLCSIGENPNNVASTSSDIDYTLYDEEQKYKDQLCSTSLDTNCIRFSQRIKNIEDKMKFDQSSIKKKKKKIHIMNKNDIYKSQYEHHSKENEDLKVHDVIGSGSYGVVLKCKQYLEHIDPSNIACLCIKIVENNFFSDREVFYLKSIRKTIINESICFNLPLFYFTFNFNSEIEDFSEESRDTWLKIWNSGNFENLKKKIENNTVINKNEKKYKDNRKIDDLNDVNLKSSSFFKKENINITANTIKTENIKLICQEYCGNHDLGQFIKLYCKKMQKNDYLCLYFQILFAIYSLHEAIKDKCILHRDLCLKNIMIMNVEQQRIYFCKETKTFMKHNSLYYSANRCDIILFGKTFNPYTKQSFYKPKICKIIDFGLSSMKNTNNYTNYSVHFPICTLFQRPPEMIFFDSNKIFYNKKSEVWCLGITFLESLMIGTPFENLFQRESQFIEKNIDICQYLRKTIERLCFIRMLYKSSKYNNDEKLNDYCNFDINKDMKIIQNMDIVFIDKEIPKFVYFFMNLIYIMGGMPNISNYSNIENSILYNFLKNKIIIYDSGESLKIKEIIISKIGHKGLQLLSSMLQWDHKLRPNIEDLLKSKLFQFMTVETTYSDEDPDRNSVNSVSDPYDSNDNNKELNYKLYFIHKNQQNVFKNDLGKFKLNKSHKSLKNNTISKDCQNKDSFVEKHGQTIKNEQIENKSFDQRRTKNVNDTTENLKYYSDLDRSLGIFNGTIKNYFCEKQKNYKSTRTVNCCLSCDKIFFNDNNSVKYCKDCNKF